MATAAAAATQQQQQDSEMVADTKMLIRALLTPAQEGMSVNELQHEYQFVLCFNDCFANFLVDANAKLCAFYFSSLNGHSIPLCGFQNLAELLKSMPDTVKVVLNNRFCIICHVHISYAYIISDCT